jgi:hypothetical protein
MVAFVRRLAIRYGIYRRYPLPRIPALKSAGAGRRPRQMDPAYFRALAARCRKSAGSRFDPFAQEEFRRLAHEFETITRGREPNSPTQLEQATRRQPAGGNQAEIVRSRFGDRGTK